MKRTEFAGKTESNLREDDHEEEEYGSDTRF